MLPSVNVNYLAVLVAAVVSFLLGWLWHSPVLFGKMYMKLSNMDKMDKKKIDAMKKRMGQSLFFQFVATVLMSYILAHFVGYTGAKTIADGAVLGIWIWLGFVATIMIGMVIWERKPVKLFLINAGHVLVSLIVMGAILAVWA